MKETKQIYAFIDSQNLNLGVLNPRYINGKRIIDWQLDFVNTKRDKLEQINKREA